MGDHTRAQALHDLMMRVQEHHRLIQQGGDPPGPPGPPGPPMSAATAAAFMPYLSGLQQARLGLPQKPEPHRDEDEDIACENQPLDFSVPSKQPRLMHPATGVVSGTPVNMPPFNLQHIHAMLNERMLAQQRQEQQEHNPAKMERSDAPAKNKRESDYFGSDGHSDRSSSNNSPSDHHHHTEASPPTLESRPVHVRIPSPPISSSSNLPLHPNVASSYASLRQQQNVGLLTTAPSLQSAMMAAAVKAASARDMPEMAISPPADSTIPSRNPGFNNLMSLPAFNPLMTLATKAVALQEASVNSPHPATMHMQSTSPFFSSSPAIKELSKVNDESNRKFSEFRDSMIRQLEATRCKGRKSSGSYDLPCTPNSSSSGLEAGEMKEGKDAAYWERRRKNNEAAKRSRDARRCKENEVAVRAQFLEQENMQLKLEIASLRSELGSLHARVAAK